MFFCKERYKSPKLGMCAYQNWMLLILFFVSKILFVLYSGIEATLLKDKTRHELQSGSILVSLLQYS